MKNVINKIAVTFLLVICYNLQAVAQGQFAGDSKNLLGITYEDSRHIQGLDAYQFLEGSLVSAIDDPESVVVAVYTKGTTSVVFFSIMEDSSTHVYTVMDVLEIKNIQPGWQIRTTFCRQNKIEDAEIVALVKGSASEEYLTYVKQAWRFSRNKRKFQQISIKDIDCLSEGGG